MKPIVKTLYVLLVLCVIVAPTFAQNFGRFNQNTLSGSGSTSSQRSYYSNGMIGEAIIEADRDSRSIIVITDEYTNKHVEQIIKNLDRPIQQVLIKVVFIEVTYRDDVDFGIEAALDINNDRAGSNTFETLFGLAAESRGGFYQLLEKDVSVTLRAIAEVGKLEVLSRPSILTRNNQEAVITVGQYVPFVTNSRVTSDGQTINTVEYEDIGIILQVTPFITQEGLVEMILSPEISTLTDETVPISDTINSPVFAKRSADTVVVTPNGQTIVIGGMMEDNTTETNNKVPILGDIPLLGMAFRRNIKETSKTELLIFLTPYVMEGPNSLIEMTKKEQDMSNLIPQAFPETELDRYLDKLPQEKETDMEEQTEKPERKTNSKGRPIF